MLQHDCSKIYNNQESKLLCEFHPECKLKILHFGEKSQRKSRMLCVQCIIESQNKKDNLDQLVYMHNFLLNPKNSLLQIIQTNNGESTQDASQTLDEIINLLQSSEESIKNQFIKIKENIQQIRMQLEQREQEFCNELKLNDVVKQIQLLKQMDSYQGTNELTNIENQLNFISQNLNKAYIIANDKVMNNWSAIINNLNDNIQRINKQIETWDKLCNDKLKKLQFIDMKIIEDIKDFPQIHQQISEEKNIEYQLLYKGSRDGLNAAAYWNKCNLQQNLLTIMTSKNGNKFGGYSPCQINKVLSGYVQDPSMKSFIFQQNKKEIYKLKVKEYPFQCHLSYGPIFGSDDIQIKADFQQGTSSNLGYYYDISGSNIQNKASHIFGETTPQLQECKVYKVIFN